MNPNHYGPGPEGGQFAPAGSRAPSGLSEVRNLWHMTSLGAAQRVIADGSIHPLGTLNPALAKEIYTEGGADHVYLGLTKQVAINNAVGDGVIFHVMGKQLMDRTLVDPVAEGGIAMVRGSIPLTHVAGIEFSDPKMATTPQGRALIHMYEHAMRSR